MNQINRSEHFHPVEIVQPPKAQKPRRGNASPHLVLAIVCVGICLANLDLFIVNVALPNIGRDFSGASLEDLSWVLNGYAIAYAALMTPTSLGLLMAAFPPERRSYAVRTWTAIGGVAAALGPVIGGLLVTMN